jgi:hypothetical protein
MGKPQTQGVRSLESRSIFSLAIPWPSFRNIGTRQSTFAFPLAFSLESWIIRAVAPLDEMRNISDLDSLEHLCYTALCSPKSKIQN